MKIISLAVERPVTTTMFYAAVVLLGIVALIKLPRELFPTITFPELLVVTRYGAAAPEEIENIITKLVEEQAGTVPNLRKVRSISREGLSVVILEFNWGTDMGMAHLSVREKIDLIKDRLPIEAEEPIIQMYNPFAQPMMILSISGDMPLSELTRLSNDVVKKRLQKVDGVASANVSGGQTREILVEVDLDKMQSSNISISGIVDSLKTSNVNYPAGTTQGRFFEYLIRTIGEYKTVQDIGKTVIAVDSARESPEYMLKSMNQRKGAESFQPKAQRLVPLNSIAQVIDTFKETDSYSRHNGRPNISIAIQKQFDANTIKSAHRVRDALKELGSSLPQEMKLEIVYDESIFISGSLEDVVRDVVTGGILAFLVLLFFLRSFKDSLIVTLALPISILCVFIYLFFAGRTINVIALAGISLGIGAMIDNAIVILDNIVETRHKYKDDKEASYIGASQVAVAQITSMLTNICVFFPLMFAKGLAQQLFKDLFFAAVISHIAALSVALTLLPRITAYPFKLGGKKEGDEQDHAEEELRRQAAAKENADDDMMIGARGVTKILKDKNPASGIGGEALNSRLDTGMRQDTGGLNGEKKNILIRIWKWLVMGLTPEREKALNKFYYNLIVWSISNRKKVAYLVGALFMFSMVIFYFEPKIFMPTVDQGQFLVKVNMPVGTRLDVTNRIMEKVEAIISKMPEIKDTLVRVGASSEESIEALGPNQSECIATIDREKAKVPTGEVILRLKEKIKPVNLEGAEVEYLLQDSSMKSVTGGGGPIAITIKGPDLAVLRKMSEDMQDLLKKIPGIEGVKTSLALPSHETRVNIDKDRASAFGLNVSEIARASLIGIHGFIATYYKEEGKEIGIRVRLRAEDRNNPQSIQKMALRTQQGLMVPMGDVANVISGYGPSEIQRIDQQRAIVVSAQVFGRGLGETVEEVDQKLLTFRKTKDYSVELGGVKQEVQESFGGLIIAFILAAMLIYMIMAAGFESLLHPFLIMFTMPLGIIGVAIILPITMTPLSAPVILGTVLLGGIVVNNGIILIDHINYLRHVKNEELKEAVIEGCVHRLRPVLMTALVTSLSLVPVALGIGQGTAISAPMAIATLGGLMVSTALTLIILPIIYITVEERRDNAAKSA